MEQPEIQEKIIQLLEEEFDICDAEAGSMLSMDLGLEAEEDLDEFEAALEEFFGIEIEEDSDFRLCSTVEDVATFLEEVLAED